MGSWGIDDEGRLGICKWVQIPEKRCTSLPLIKQCQKLALTAREPGEFLRRRAKLTWEHVEVDLSEWSEHKGVFCIN